MKKKHLFIALYAIPGLLAAQGETGDQQTDDALNMSSTFIGDVDLFLRDANKLDAWPQIKDDVVEMPPIVYTIIPNKLQVDAEPQPIKPARVKVEEPLKKLYRGYARAGFGLYTTPLLEGYFMDGRSRDGAFSIHAKHLSSAGGVAAADSIPDSFSNNEIHLWGKRFRKRHAIEGGFDWNREVIHYYGFDPDLFPGASIENEQKFNNIDGFFRLSSFQRDTADINYNGQVMFYNFSDAFEGIENNLDFKAHAQKYVDSELFSADFNFNYNSFDYLARTDEDKKGFENAIISLTPQVSTIHNNWRITVGMGLFVDAKAESPFHFYPQAHAQYSFFDDLIIPYAGVRGMLERSTYKDIAARNPFIQTDPELKSVNHKLELYGGVRGTISSSASFNAGLSFKQYEDFMYFINDSLVGPGNQFQLLYDDLAVTNLSGEITINSTDELKLLVRGDYFLYGTDVEEHPWHQPTTKLTVSGIYNIQDKFIVSGEVYTMGKRKAKSLVPVVDIDPEPDGSTVVDLNGFADLNLMIEYRYTKRLSAFLRFNNMFAAKYALWNNYNVQRFNAMMGATYSF